MEKENRNPSKGKWVNLSFPMKSHTRTCIAELTISLLQFWPFTSCKWVTDSFMAPFTTIFI